MAILAFQKPDKVLMLEADSRFGKFEFRPLEPGFGRSVCYRGLLLGSGWQGKSSSDGAQLGASGGGFQDRKSVV